MYMGVAAISFLVAILVMTQDHLNKTSFPFPKDVFVSMSSMRGSRKFCQRGRGERFQIPLKRADDGRTLNAGLVAL